MLRSPCEKNVWFSCNDLSLTTRENIVESDLKSGYGLVSCRIHLKHIPIYGEGLRAKRLVK
jgi:hypothetical protein